MPFSYGQSIRDFTLDNKLTITKNSKGITAIHTINGNEYKLWVVNCIALLFHSLIRETYKPLFTHDVIILIQLHMAMCTYVAITTFT